MVMKVCFSLQDRLKKGGLLLAFLLVSAFAFGQLSDNSLPASFGITEKQAKIIPLSRLDSVHVADRLGEDVREGVPNRFGVVQALSVDIREKGVKTELADQTVWQYEISCPDALSLSVFFETFQLPEGAAVYVYNKDKTLIRGGFTHINNKDDGQLALAVFPDNKLIVEYNEPLEADFPGQLVIGAVSKAYLDVKSVALSQVFINCPEGSDWQDEKRSVCLMTYQDARFSYYCTGALVNNVRTDGTPYFLTANHCLSTAGEAATLVTYFNYENSTCTSNDASREQTLSGSGLVATNNYTDFTLLLLSEYPTEDYAPYFAGWDAGGQQPASGTCIHHPEGGPKNIALDQDPPVSYAAPIIWDGNFTSQANTHWEVTYDVGLDQSGSSGSPLFDGNKRVIGQLHGGDDVNSYFGKFSLSWNYSSDPARQLKNWLDPDNTGLLQLDGWDYFSVPRANFEADVTVACLETPVQLTDLSRNKPESWLWQIQPAGFAFVNGTSANSQHPEIIFTAEGNYTVSLTVGNENGTDQVVFEDLITAFQELPVALDDMPEVMSLCGSDLQNYEFSASGANSFEFKVTADEFFDKQVSGNLLFLTLKEETRKYGSFETYVKVTGTHGNCSSADSVLLQVVMPENDDVSQAIALKLGRNAYFSNECATVETREPYPTGSGCNAPNAWCVPASGPVLDNSVWFTFPGTSSGLITIETSGFDTQIAVYEAESAADIVSGVAARYTLLAANDNSSLGTASVIENLAVDPSKTYFLQVDGQNGDYGEMAISLISQTIEVYPNPSTGLFHFTLGEVEGSTVELAVYSMTGQRVFARSVSFAANENTVDVDLTSWPAGLYFFRVKLNGTVLAKKLMVTK